ncbi:hypothetical protein N8702_01170 [Verrucomicrobia bacterium]|nr:hypothetical protein [Verrucomicrobiota bacterium]
MSKIITIFAEESYQKSYPQILKSIVVLNYPNLLPPTKNFKHFQRKNLCYIGAVTRQRGIFKYLDIIEKLKETDIKLKIIGKFYDKSLQTEVENIIQSKDLKVTLTGFIPSADLIHHTQDVAFGLCYLDDDRNLRQSNPTKIFDYINLELIPIANKYPITQKIMSEHGNKFLARDNKFTNHVVQIVNKCIDDDLFHTKLKRKVSSLKNKYNWNTEEDKFLKLVNQNVQ